MPLISEKDVSLHRISIIQSTNQQIKPTMYTNFPTYIVSAPIVMVQNYAQTQAQTQARTHTVKFDTVRLLSLYKTNNAIITDLKTAILDFTPTDAQSVMDALQINKTLLIQSVQFIMALPVPSDTYEKRLLKEIQKLANNLIELINDLHLIANRAEIDENSADYKDFFVNLAIQNMQNDKSRTVGYANFLTLVNQ